MQSPFTAKIFGDHEDPRRRLQELFGGDLPTSGQPPAPALDWAREVLGASADASASGVGLVDAVCSDTAERDIPGAVDAIAALRQAEPRLTLRAATFLAEHARR